MPLSSPSPFGRSPRYLFSLAHRGSLCFEWGWRFQTPSKTSHPQCPDANRGCQIAPFLPRAEHPSLLLIFPHLEATMNAAWICRTEKNFQATSRVLLMLSCGTSNLLHLAPSLELLLSHTPPFQIDMASAVVWRHRAARTGHTFGGRRNLL